VIIGHNCQLVTLHSRLQPDIASTLTRVRGGGGFHSRLTNHGRPTVCRHANTPAVGLAGVLFIRYYMYLISMVHIVWYIRISVF